MNVVPWIRLSKPAGRLDVPLEASLYRIGATHLTFIRTRTSRRGDAVSRIGIGTELISKMEWLAVCVLLAAIYGGGGVTKTSGIEQFWTDDYKVFEQVYGKTSDKDLFGATLPPSIGFGSDTKNTQASEKKERYLLNFQKDSDDYDSDGFGDKYNLLTPAKKNKPSFNFISYNNFKPISQNNDPETYNYLKHLEEMENEKKTKYPETLGGFKPYINTVGPNPEDTDAYKSIQDILDAHEANKGSDDDEESKYLTYRDKGKKKRNRNKPNSVRNKDSKPRCFPGRCRKRSSVSYRIRSRPLVRRIKQRIIY